MQIEESAGDNAFTLPTSLQIPCGTAPAQTFTVTNTFGHSGITNYQWNLGANNGWQYNGVPAAASISTGTTNSITLTPILGSALSNVTAVVSLQGTTASTNTTTVSLSNPSFTVTGPDAICNSTNQIYSIASLPSGASVSWSASPSGIVTLTPSGNQISVQRNGSARGAVALTATVNACGANSPVLKNFYVGTPSASTFMYFNGQNYPNYTSNICVDAGQYYDVYIPPYPGATGYNWTISPSGVASINYGSGTEAINIVITGSQGAPIDITVQAQNACGYGTSTVVMGEVCGEIIPPRVAISPNPASNVLNIESSPQGKDNEKPDILGVKIYDGQGTLKLQQKFATGNKKAQMNVSQLRKGVYYVEIFNGKTKSRQALMVQR